MLEEERNWSELPPEVLLLIAKRLPDLLCFLRFRAVCKPWRCSAPLSDPPHQLPWLLELDDSEVDPQPPGLLGERQRFYSVSSGETLVIPFTDRAPPLEDWINGGVCGHYLAFNAPDFGVSFFNPLSSDLFSLPPMQMPLHYGTPWMVWTGTDPIRDRRIVVVDRDRTLYNEIGGWTFYDPHKSEWVEQEGYYYSSCYWQGMLFSTHSGRHTEVFDVYTKELLHKVPPPEIEVIKGMSYNRNELAWHLRRSYLLESSGVILRVSQFYDREVNNVEETVFHIHRLHFETPDGKPCWVQIHDIGDQILFLEEMNGFSLTARPSTGFKEGCIYFIDPGEYKPYVHDVLAGTTKRVPCPFNRCTWFLPGL